jgi:outer membrane protein OmpA-like peptidoglycan-associated protein
MTTWSKAVGAAVLGFLLVPAGFAQQAQDQSQNQNATDTANSAVAPASTQPPAPAPAPKETNPLIKPGTDYNHWDAFLGYSYERYRPEFSGNGQTFGLNGGSASITYYVNRWFGLTFDFGGAHTSSCVDGPGCVGNTTSTGAPKTTYNTNLFTYTGGARFRWVSRSRATPFFDITAGAAHGTDFFTWSGNKVTAISSNSFALLAGAGIDIRLNDRISWRAVQTDYLMTRFTAPASGAADPQNNIRVSTGLVFTWGRHPVIVPQPPTVSLSADKTSIVDGSGDVIHLHATASSPVGFPLTYNWSDTCGAVQGSNADAQWTQGSAGVGTCTVTVRVDDGHAGTASASLDLHVEPKPAPRPPTMTCSVDRNSVMAGERVTVTANANSPENFPLNYTWRSNAGQVTGTGASVQFDTSGLAPGTYTVTGRVDDGHGGAADCQASVTVQQPPPPPQASKINECTFKTLNSSRVDNVCKRVLDDVALRLQNEPTGTVVIIGYADPKERHPDKLAMDRGNNAAKYLTDKGIDQSRISVRPGTGQPGAGEANRRIEIIWVPQGATY